MLCFLGGEGSSIDLSSAAVCFKCSADEGNALGQCFYGKYLRDGTEISSDLISTAHFFKLSADHENTLGQWCHGICLREGEGISRDLMSAPHYFNLSADQGDASANGAMAHVFEMGQGFHKI
jgi:TPR repeat protein